MRKTNNLNIANGRPKDVGNLVIDELVDNKHVEDIQEIITKTPSWILHWGITAFFGILLMMVAVSIVIRYPDIIKGGIKLASSDMSVQITVPSTGSITKLFVQQWSTVKKGQPLAEVRLLDGVLDPFILKAPKDGKIGFVGIVQQGAFVRPNQTVFILHPRDEQFFGIMEISAGSINKIKDGQRVLISFKDYPSNEYGQLKGRVTYVAGEPLTNGFFTAQIIFDHNSESNKPIELKSWMVGYAEIITGDATLFSRISRNIIGR